MSHRRPVGPTRKVAAGSSEHPIPNASNPTECRCRRLPVAPLAGETFPMNVTEPHSPDSISLDETLSLLASRQRRFLLYGLSLYSTPVSLARLTDTVTELEHGRPAEQYADERLDIYTGLYHNHLPRLVDAGVVQYDQSADMVGIGHNAVDLVPLLESTVEHDLPEGRTDLSVSPDDIDSLTQWETK